MAISLASLTKKTASSAPIVLLYGVAGVGKTSLAAEFPEPVFFRVGDGENAPVGVETNGFDITSYDDLMQAIGALYGEEHEFKTLVIDSLTSLESIIQKETCKRNNWQTLEDPGYGKGYVANGATWAEYLEGVAALRKERGMAIVQIGHPDIARFDSPTSDPYSRYRVSLHKNAVQAVEASSDMILFVNYRVTVKKVEAGFNKTVAHGESGGVRVIHTEERAGFIAKNRFNMPAELPFKKGQGYAEIAKYLPKSA